MAARRLDGTEVPILNLTAEARVHAQCFLQVTFGFRIRWLLSDPAHDEKDLLLAPGQDTLNGQSGKAYGSEPQRCSATPLHAGRILRPGTRRRSPLRILGRRHPLHEGGGSLHHYLISENLRTQLSDVLKGRNCQPFSSGVPAKTPTLLPYRYPDISVVCGEMKFENIHGIDVLTNPILIVEVLSPGTEHLDKEIKRNAYQKIPSLKEYLIVAQDAPHIIQYKRQGRRWVRQDVGDLNASLELISINSQVLISDIYEGIAFN